MALKRLKKEFSDIKKNSIDGVLIEPDNDNLFLWKGIIDGPDGTPYEDGRFDLIIKIPSQYPFKAPIVNFETPIYHCNISKDGEICLDILKDQWSPALTISNVLLSIQSLLNEPNPKDPLRAEVADLLLSDRKKHDDIVRRHIKNI